jgi:hypothetical protein
MNQILAGIYGTPGFEKVASEGGHPFSTLSDLALAITTETVVEGSDLEKVASVHGSVLEELEFFDLSGRAAAHAQFSEFEKAASEGDTSGLEEFFQDVIEENDGAYSEAAAVKQAILVELARRQG